MAINETVALRMGNADRRRYHDVPIAPVPSGRLDPRTILTQTGPMTGAIAACTAYDARRPGWIEVARQPSA